MMFTITGTKTSTQMEQNNLSSEQIQEMNKDIAEFMGWEYCNGTQKEGVFIPKGWVTMPCFRKDKEMVLKLRYNEDMNLLYDACKKFCELPEMVEIGRLNTDVITKQQRVIYNGYSAIKRLLIFNKFDKQFLFITLHEAVKWYNMIKVN